MKTKKISKEITLYFYLFSTLIGYVLLAGALAPAFTKNGLSLYSIFMKNGHSKKKLNSPLFLSNGILVRLVPTAGVLTPAVYSNFSTKSNAL